ncbi:AMP-binding protein [Hyphomicrobium sp.]|uniref:AMP-binding protein n=1 Tax=Hyphomicrobium sp. TaxID=82 RepID=UPI002FE24BD3
MYATDNRCVRDASPQPDKQVDPSSEGASTLAALLETQVARTPNAVALTSAGPKIRCAELDEQGNRIAWQLIARGLGPESVVALLLNRTPALVAAILAVLKASAANLPIDLPRQTNAWRSSSRIAHPALC